MHKIFNLNKSWVILQDINFLNNNTIINENEQVIIVIDPSFNFDYVLTKKYLALTKIVVLTHAHSDHVGNDMQSWINWADKIYVSKFAKKLINNNIKTRLFFGENSPSLDLNKLIYVEDQSKHDDMIFFLTPGHSPDSMCIYKDNLLATGDLLFADSIGRTDFEYSDINQMRSSLTKIKNFLIDNSTVTIIPGHEEWVESRQILKNKMLFKI